MKFWVFAFVFYLVSHPFALADGRIKIGVVDTGINNDPYLHHFLCEEESVDLTGRGMKDYLGHGSAVMSLVVDGLDASRYCVVMIKWLHGENDPTPRDIISRAVTYADHIGAKYLNMSLGGGRADMKEEMSLSIALSHGMQITVAAGNDGEVLDEICMYFPACYQFHTRNFHVVGSYENGFRPRSSNYGPRVTDTAPGWVNYRGQTSIGTSFAAPRVLNRIIRGIK